MKDTLPHICRYCKEEYSLPENTICEISTTTHNGLQSEKYKELTFYREMIFCSWSCELKYGSFEVRKEKAKPILDIINKYINDDKEITISDIDKIIELTR